MMCIRAKNKSGKISFLQILALTSAFAILFTNKTATSENVNPCQPSPCGSNSQCRELNGQAVCSCLSEYIGRPPACRPECVIHSECPSDKACINQKCTDPCPGLCGENAECNVLNHNPLCSCKTDFTGDAFTRCYPLPPQKPTNPCIPSPCGPNSQCRETNGAAVCSCGANYIGAPPSCRPECTTNAECSSDMACINGKCRDPCPGTCGLSALCNVINHTPNCSCPEGYSGEPFSSCKELPPPPPLQATSENVNPCQPSPCGSNSQCREWNGQAVCSCLSEYIGRPPACRPECVIHSECPSDKACINQKCTDPCPGLCGENAECNVLNHNPLCSCKTDFTGDAFTRCYPLPPQKPTNPCIPSPCGPNSQCRETNGAAVCSCGANYIGAPPSCRPECTTNAECPSVMACINKKCRDPCPGTCGLSALCKVINHTPSCSCPEGYSGEPFSSCKELPPPPPLPVSGACNTEEWDCDDGQCIDRDNLCDGEVNCDDGSDEIAENCIAIPCAQFAFRCTYGGCVAGNAKCNDKKSCADNSDEMPHLCASTSEIMNLERQLMGDCGDSYFKCQQTGECIENMNRCDGHADCRDGSDETVELCSTTSCPQFAFRCGYGGCVAGNARCNGVDDCFDASDESAKLCDRPRRRNIGKNITRITTNRGGNQGSGPPPPPPTQLPLTTKKPPTIPTTPTKTSQNTCQLPRESDIVITDINGRTLQPGSMVSVNTIVKFQCQKGYTLSGKLNNFCMGRQWNDPLPTCQKFCSTADLKGLSTFINCERDGGKVTCSDAVPPRTVARVGCATGFTLQNDVETRLLCELHGDWNFKRSKCKMQCGKVVEATTKFSRGGHPINIYEVPWHVGIYSNFGGSFEHICGGTIISPRLVISAAHCFWNEAFSKLYDKKHYNVVAGKYYRDYNKEQDQYQSSALKDIVLENPYRDRAANYRNDIAVLRLETALQFTASVKPVCLRFERNALKEVETGTVGKFAGWGITVNLTAADELQSVTMSAISNVDCRKELQQLNYSLPDDKFCLKDEWGKSACRGDSGGGYVLAQNYEGSVTHYLIGIISHAPARDQDCAVDGVVALTNVNYFERLIEDLRDEETLYF